MKKKFNILFPIETASRELLYKTVLAAKLAEKGHNCFIGSKNEIFKILDRLGSIVYFDKGYHKGSSESIYKIIKNKNGVIINLDEEGGVDYDNCSTILDRYSEIVFRSCDLVFFWGSTQYELVRQSNKYFDENISELSGHPRFELLKKKYQFLYQEEINKIKNKYNNYFLINTNMGFGNNIKGDVFVKNNYGDRIKDIDKVIRYDKKKVSSYINLINLLSKKTENNIILRPHPEENINTYLRKIGNSNNIHVVFEGSVVPWIIGSELMIHPDCTTGIEAYMIGKTSISYLPASNDFISTYVPVMLSHRINNEDDIIKFIINKSFLAKKSNEYNYLVDDYFSFRKESIEKIEESLGKVLMTKETNEFYEIDFKYKVTRKIRKVLGDLYFNLIKDKSYMLSENKLKGFSLKKVTQILDCLHNGNFNKKLNVEKINSKLFLIKD